MPTDNTIGSFAIGRDREVRVSVGEFKGTDIIQIRRWVQSYSGDADDRIPTKQGIAFSIEQLPEAIRVLQKAEAHAREFGLLDEPVEGKKERR